MATKRQACAGLAAAVIVAVTVTTACSAGAGRSSGPATVHVSASPNGEAAKTGPQVLADATSALSSEPTVHIVGTSTGGGMTEKVDLRVQQDGLTGSVQTPQGSGQLLSVNGKFYLKGRLAFGGSSPLPKSIASALDGRWLYLDPSDNTGGMSMGASSDPPMNLKGLAASLRTLDNGAKIEPAVATASLNGRQVVVVSDSQGSRMYVSATGAPLPLDITGKGGGSTGLDTFDGEVTFSYGDDPVKLQAPAGAISMQKLIEQLLPSAFPTQLPSDFPTELLSQLPSSFPSGLPSALASQLRAIEQQHPNGVGHGAPVPAPTPTP